MALTNAFNLQSKTKAELNGLYAELFNRLADQNIYQQKREQYYSMMYHLKQALAYNNS